MSYISFFIFLPFLYFIFIFIQRSSSAIIKIDQKTKSDETFSFLHKISSINGHIEDNVEELRCPKNWLQLGYSCYLLSDYMSTAIQANHTCDLLHLNKSRLIYIQQSIQLIYAAHILLKNNLNSLILETDQDLMKGGKIVDMLSSDDYLQWKEFKKKILQDKLKDYKETTQSSKQLLRKHRYSDENSIDRESTRVVNKEDIDQNKFENVDFIHEPCDEIKWNVVDENSNILMLTIEIQLNESICSLSNANMKAAYSHLCQYVLDHCLNNIICGKHGQCVNSLSGFNCSCSFLYDGLFCEKLSTKDIQFMFGLPFFLVSPLLLIKTIRDWLLRTLKEIFSRLRRKQSSKTDQNKQTNDTQATSGHANNQPADESGTEFKLSTDEQHIRFVLVFIVSILFFLFILAVPFTRYFVAKEINRTNSSKFNLLFNDDIHRKEQYERNTVLRIDNWILLIISIVFTIFFSFFDVRNESNDKNQSRIVEPIKPFYITDRKKTVVITVIQMFEILKILDETLVDISEASKSGIFVKIFIRMFFVIANAFRYYPVLASLQFQNIIVRFSSFVYIISITVFMVICDNSYIYWLTFFKKDASLERINLPIDMDLWSFIYRSAKDCLYWILIGYIGAELTMRLFYDSIYIALKNDQNITDKTYRKIEQYAFSQENMEQLCSKTPAEDETIGESNITERGNSQEPDSQEPVSQEPVLQEPASQEPEGCWSSIKKYFRDQFRIYITDTFKCEVNFRFTTIVIATYTIAFIFLFYLTFTLIFLYTTEKTNYITYLKQILEHLLNIKIKERSFTREVVFSAFITMLIYGLQFLHSIKNYRDNVTELYNIYSVRKKPSGKPDDNEIISKSVQYPAYILQYLLGGFVICFNLILFIVIMSKTIVTRITSFKWTLISIMSVIIVYILHKMINIIINELFTRNNSGDQKKIRPYSILLYFNVISTSFIGVISSIIRLITSVLVNILFMPRIDYSCFVEPLQTHDSAHMAFKCFIHWEFLYTRDILLRFSKTTKPASNSDIPIRENTAEAETDQNGNTNHKNTDVKSSSDASEPLLNNTNRKDSISEKVNPPSDDDEERHP